MLPDEQMPHPNEKNRILREIMPEIDLIEQRGHESSRRIAAVISESIINNQKPEYLSEEVFDWMRLNQGRILRVTQAGDDKYMVFPSWNSPEGDGPLSIISAHGQIFLHGVNVEMLLDGDELIDFQRQKACESLLPEIGNHLFGDESQEADPKKARELFDNLLAQFPLSSD